MQAHGPENIAKRRLSFVLDDGLSFGSNCSPGGLRRKSGIISPRSPLMCISSIHTNSPGKIRGGNINVDSPKKSPFTVLNVASKKYSSTGNENSHPMLKKYNSSDPAKADAKDMIKYAFVSSTKKTFRNCTQPNKALIEKPSKPSPVVPKRMVPLRKADTSSLRNRLLKSYTGRTKTPSCDTPERPKPPPPPVVNSSSDLRCHLLQNGRANQNETTVDRQSVANDTSPPQWQSPSLYRTLISPDDNVKQSKKIRSPLFENLSPVLKDPCHILCVNASSQRCSPTPSPSNKINISQSRCANAVLPTFCTLPNYGFEIDSEMKAADHVALLHDIVENDRRCIKSWQKYLNENLEIKTDARRSHIPKLHICTSSPTTKELTAEHILSQAQSSEWVETLVKSVGIPAELRGMVWLRWSGALAKQRSHREDYYQCLANQIKEESITESFTIEVDLLRTCPDHWFFSRNSDFKKRYPHRTFPQAACGGGVVILHRILKAYALRNQTIGYVQGMNYLAAFLLLVTGNETHTFWLFATLLEDIFPGYYGQRLNGFQVDSIALQDYLKRGLPSMCKAMDQTCIPIDFVIPKWYLCLFFNTFHPYQVARIWDIIFFAPHLGKATIMQVSMGIMTLKQKSVLIAASRGDIAEMSIIMQRTDDCTDGFDKIMEFSRTLYGNITVAFLDTLRVKAKKTLKKQKARRKIYHKKKNEMALERHNANATTAEVTTNPMEECKDHEHRSNKRCISPLIPAWMAYKSAQLATNSESEAKKVSNQSSRGIGSGLRFVLHSIKAVVSTPRTSKHPQCRTNVCENQYNPNASGEKQRIQNTSLWVGSTTGNAISREYAESNSSANNAECSPVGIELTPTPRKQQRQKSLPKNRGNLSVKMIKY